MNQVRRLAPALDRADLVGRADSLRTGGRLDDALAAYAEVSPATRTEATGPVAAGLAWRVAGIHLERGEQQPALNILGRVGPCVVTTGPAEDSSDRALVEAGLATAYWSRGDLGRAVEHAESAHQAATASGAPRARAAAHVAVALVRSLGGDPADVIEHYRRARKCAERAEDLHLLARVEINLSHHYLADARYTAAVDSAVSASATAERASSPSLTSVALENEAEGLVRLGRCEEAVDRYDRVLALAERIGTPRTAGALIGLGQVHERQRAPEQQLAALEQAHRLTTTPGSSRETRILALSGLARALAGRNPARARAIAEEAVASARGGGIVPAAIASGHVALAVGDREMAAEAADRAVTLARHRRERASLAEALELLAETERASRAQEALREAHGIWGEAGAGYDADRVAVRLAALAPRGSADRLVGRVAAARRVAAGQPVPETEPRVKIRTFGRFEVRVDGSPVPTGAWQSRRARDLLRTLVSRRGRTTPRPELCELLWPDEEPEATAHRLSVLLSILRGVLGSEAVNADRDSVGLCSTAVRVDVEEFVRDVADAAELVRQGSPDAARVLLGGALDRRTDAPFADAPYDDATLDLREEAAARYVQALRLMAELCRGSGECDEAAAWLRRLLAAEPYDEEAHLTLVAVLTEGRRHGQARAAADRHRAAMADLGLPLTG